MAVDTLINLNTEELTRIKNFVSEMQNFKIKNGVINNNAIDRSQTDFERFFDGTKAEFAVAKVLGTEMNSYIGFKGDGGTDLIYNNKTIQVKYTKYYSGRLTFNTLEEFSSDIAILVVKSGTKLKISGFITKEEFLRKNKKLDLGFGIRYCIEQNDLDNINELL